MAENVVTLNAQGEEEVHENVSGVELKTESGGTATFIHDAEIKQPDWSQEDSAQKDYIKNKPKLARVATAGTYASLDGKLFGDIPTILEETELTFEKFAEDIPTYVAEVDGYKEAFLGEMYRVIWDGTEYLCECKDGVLVEGGTSIDNLYFIGNKHIFWGAGFGEDTGEPFLIYVSVLDAGVKIEIEATATETHTVSITPVNSVKKLDKKYMPDGLATEEFVKAEISEIEIPEGGGSSGGVSSWNDLTDKPFGEETATAIAEQEQTFSYDSTYGAFAASVFYGGTYPLASLAVGDTCVLVWDGTEYKLTVGDASSVMPGFLFVGNGSAFGLSGNGEPFIVAWNGYLIGIISLVDTAATTHTVSMYCNVVKHLDNKYLDFVDKVETMGDVLLAEQTVEGFTLFHDGSYLASLNQAPPLVAGERYKVIWDGEVYDYIAYDADGVCLGNFETCNPFAIGYSRDSGDMDFITATSEDSHRIGIYHVTGETCKIKPNCLPKIAAISDLAAAPTAEDFNALLAALRSAGYLATE